MYSLKRNQRVATVEIPRFCCYQNHILSFLKWLQLYSWFYNWITTIVIGYLTLFSFLSPFLNLSTTVNRTSNCKCFKDFIGTNQSKPSLDGIVILFSISINVKIYTRCVWHSYWIYSLWIITITVYNSDRMSIGGTVINCISNFRR